MNDDVPVRDRASTLRNTPAVTVPQGQFGLLVIVNGVVTTHPLPPAGSVTVGRARECDVQVVDASVSRNHARLTTGPEVTITDLGSANGTRMRGEQIAKETTVRVPIGEAIEIGGAILMVQQRAVPTREWRIWAHGFFEGRLEDECVRASRAGSSFGLLRLIPGDATAPNVVQQVLANLLRADDAVGLYGPGQYEILLVDRNAEDARQLKLRLKDALDDVGIRSQVGLATFPDSGRTAEVLMQRSAADAEGRKEAPDRRPASIVIQAPAMRRLVDLVERVAPGDICILILGETGVGKEVMAEEVHRQSPRRDKPFLRLNCAALSDTLLESELFGHERGAFTGANQTKAGLLETAQGGTVFLDEIGELPMPVQVKLLRVLEERKVWRVGGIKPRDIDVRFVAATNRDLEVAVAEHTFRQDLYFRLNGVTLQIPPLRERREEIEGMAQAFIAQVARQMGRTEPALRPDALQLMLNYSWPGNVRELRNAIERAVLLAGGGDIEREHFAIEKMTATVSTPMAQPLAPTTPRPPPGAGGDFPDSEDVTGQTELPPIDAGAEPHGRLSLAEQMRQQVKEVERQHIIDALARCGGNQTRAARELGISRRTLISRLEEYNIPRPLKDRR